MKLVLTQPELSFDPGSDNAATARELLLPLVATLEADDVVLLPEHFDLGESRETYEAGISELARVLGCHVVGGSHHEARGAGKVNTGVVANDRGEIIAAYEKLRPYAEERGRVDPGGSFGEVTVGGKRLLILICADFWFSDVFYRASALPDLVLVPAFSVSRKPTPEYSRALWQHLAVARAYEFGAYVGVSDWPHHATGGAYSPSGVAGFADPTAVAPLDLFRGIDGAVRVVPLDFDALDAFRADRTRRGFFWKAKTTTREP
ncbi:MAG TPA: carbon-nitrogen hydrolase family protein [Polyangiaceae bacterium]|jgi:predicted amidohydrolase|nr:carbon-nitrogen hydrolase family protein [Polyangiaceae bacterium]